MNLLNILACVVVSAIFTAWFIPKILLISYQKNLFDFENERKVHKGIVPRLGGVAFVPSIIISVAFIIGMNNIFKSDVVSRTFDVSQAAFGLCSIFVLYFEEIMDDLVGLRYRHKFLIQILCAALIVLSGVWITNLNGLFGINELPYYIAIPFTMLVIVFLINAINLIDGIDGLASGLSIVATFFFGVLFYSLGVYGCSALAFATFGTLCPFFLYNVFGNADKRHKIFMGDTGSQCIGLILGYLAIRLTMYNHLIGTEVSGSIILAFSILIVPSFDVIRVMIHRAKNHKNLFISDRNHIHHKLLNLGLPHKVAMVSILLFSMFFIVLNMLLLPYVNVNIILGLDILIWTVCHIFLTREIKRRNPEIQD